MASTLSVLLLLLLTIPAESKVGELCHDSSVYPSPPLPSKTSRPISGPSLIHPLPQGNYGTCQAALWCRSHSGKTSTTGSLSGLCPNDTAQKTECCFKPECAPQHGGWFCDYQGGRENCRDGAWGG
ncbi:uncharacterized protein RAG0_14865 [Rhynchosporium agropyri]|uniref:Uncharacterized protein n=1 Tax=Rhynchosporium agropyri TaxID=914238 RepID=A0A1E1LIN0_9HELO|nr:uncharacterized protein RAG0_14865 [Rhynchosporium agropyri]